MEKQILSGHLRCCCKIIWLWSWGIILCSKETVLSSTKKWRHRRSIGSENTLRGQKFHKNSLHTNTYVFYYTISVLLVLVMLLLMTRHTLTAQTNFWEKERGRGSCQDILGQFCLLPSVYFLLSLYSPFLWIALKIKSAAHVDNYLSSGPVPGAGCLKLLTWIDRVPGRGESPWLQ